MKVAIRVDSSDLLGSGHVMRCLTLADMLSSFGAVVRFICLNLPGNLSDYVLGRGFHVDHIEPRRRYASSNQEELLAELRLDEDYDSEQTLSLLERHPLHDWIIVDHYALDERWEQRVRKRTSGILVIDDLADRAHDCDLLLDQNFHYDMKSRYAGLVPDNCLLLLGPEFLLLREEFREFEGRRKNRDGTLSRLLIFFGGSDVSNETEKALQAIRLLDRDLHVDVVVGASNPHQERIRAICDSTAGMVFHCQIDYMAELMNEADLAIGAGGATTWERCYLGLPALILILTENQRIGIRQLEPTGAFVNLGDCLQVSQEQIRRHLERLLDSPQLLKELSEKASALVPSKIVYGTAEWRRLFKKEESE
ncbi:UDP-2,4-diacetamido-2,4,6-trideoxy-beta-L-altropyranose hydrolase [Saccharibacillus sacchari]|uniref:UDP-2,4-diacetamido-2,4, 6-trideoxy-beta-L-altropyranose hydrolase n=1 Tax=Saccharibacillus sacchari TaxID=456493 RepID=UPI0004B2B2DA|nr:UDP-2,4-diacetamido-2,4,6-trideoxy-beta-L-altropyranose hydrolase [Saccharibacillus sacchari]